MELEFSQGKIILQKYESELDRFALLFVEVLESLDIRYVIVSGYVAILFGRNRASEAIDFIVEKISEDKFIALWQKLKVSGFSGINSRDPFIAFRDYLSDGLALRFYRAE